MKTINDADGLPPQSSECILPAASGSENGTATVPSGNIEEGVSDIHSSYTTTEKCAMMQSRKEVL